MTRWQQITKTRRQLVKLKDRPEVSAAYWQIIDELKTQLRDLLNDHDTLRSLRAAQLRQVLALCASYRPYEPHIILTTFSILESEQ